MVRIEIRMMSHQQDLIKLGKLLSVILGHRPDELGLVPDQDGYVKVKELLKALNEEDGMRHIRKGSIDELVISLPHPPVEIKEHLIRAVSRSRLPELVPAKNTPALLYGCVRLKAYAHVLEKGIGWEPNPTLSQTGSLVPEVKESPGVILSPHEPFARRLGRRIDPNPVVLTIHVGKANQQRVQFYQFGDLYLADFIPPGCFSGPPLPREKPESRTKKDNSESRGEYQPGSFQLNPDPGKFLPKSTGYKKNKKGPDWKKGRKQNRKNNEKMWPA